MRRAVSNVFRRNDPCRLRACALCYEDPERRSTIRLKTATSAGPQRRLHPGGPPMTKAQIAAQIKHIVQNQLDDCERAIKAGTRSIALKELEDAVRQLKRLAALLEA